MAPHLRAILVVGLASMLCMAPTFAPTARAAEDKPTLLGFASGDFRQELPAFEQLAGKSPAIYQLFMPLETDWSAPWVRGILDDLDDLGVTPYVEVTTSDLGALNGGARNGQLSAMSATLATWLDDDPGHRLIIAPLPEMNLPAHAWGGDPTGFKAGYTRIRSSLLSRGLDAGQVRFVFAPNGLGGHYSSYYPGDGKVDIIGFAKINRGSPWRDYEVTFQMHIDQMKSEISHVKPILITQTASIDGNGRRGPWLDDMFEGLAANEQVIGAIYFNRNKDLDYRVLVGTTLEPAMKSGYQTWSDPSAIEWIFDGRMDAWVGEREKRLAGAFADSIGHLFEDSIRWLAQEHITTGCNPPLNTLFCPDDPVTRGQMAVFLSKAFDLPQAANDHFSDDHGTFFEDSANRMYEAGITMGCGTHLYCGDRSITREQMAAFLTRALQLPRSAVDHFDDDNSSKFEQDIDSIADAAITLGCNPPTNSRFCPRAAVTRGQMSAFIMRAMQP